jgi:hypothetical protein
MKTPQRGIGYNPKDTCACGKPKGKYAKQCNACAHNNGATKACPHCGNEIPLRAKCHCLKEPTLAKGNYLNAAESMFQEPSSLSSHGDYWAHQEQLLLEKENQHGA